jgi:hypothetical protein
VLDLVALVAEERRTYGEWKRATKALNDAKVAAHPFAVGDIIRSSKGTLAKVTAVYIKYDSARISAVLKKADGSWGKREASLYRQEWSNPVLHEKASTVSAAVTEPQGAEG